MSRLNAWDRTREICTLTCEAAAAASTIPDPDGAVGRALARHLAMALASDSIGGAAAIAHQTIDYMKTRLQFDRPIGSFQALKHRAANLVTCIATNECLVAQAVESCTQRDPEANMWVALAKAGATDAYTFIAGDCVQLFGGVGHTWAFDVHLHVKRAHLNEALGASSRAQRDFAAAALAEATRGGRVTTEIRR
jgi:alkylation response protein AidB-like acyl-CoA dehydrogenase